MANSSIALGSSLNLRSIKKSLSGLTESVRSARSSTSNIRKSVLESNRAKRESIATTGSLFRKRREAVLRRQKEDLIEAGSIGGAAKRTGKVIMNSTKGFFGRILEYVGLVLVGWAVNNLPTIMKLATDLIGRMQKYFGVLQDFVGGVSEILLGFGQMIGEVYTSISTLNFSNFQTSMTSGLQKMQSGLDRITNSTLKGVNMLTQDVSSMLKLMGVNLPEFEIPDLLEQEPKPKPEAQGQGQGAQQQQQQQQQTGGAIPDIPDPQSAEMYRIAAALTTEGNSDQGYADMLQVVANRVASRGYGSTYTEVLGAPGQFAGVYKRGLSSFKRIQTLDDASRWSGQSKATLLKVIKLTLDPARQASAASFVGGALEFRGSPATVRAVNSDSDPRNNIQADANGRIPGTVWRGSNQDNQFITSNPPGAAYVPIRPGGAAPLGGLPKAQPPAAEPQPQQKVQGPKAGSGLVESFFNMLQTKPNQSFSSINVPPKVATNTVIIFKESRKYNPPQRVHGARSPSFEIAAMDKKNLLNSDDILMLKIG